MRTEINRHEIKYIVNGKTVIATINGIEGDAYNDFLLSGDDSYPYKEEYDLSVNSVKGIAKCNENDTFDIEKGYDIAFAKLEQKYWIKYANAMMNILEDYNCTAGLISSLADKAIKRLDNADKNLSDVLNEIK